MTDQTPPKSPGESPGLGQFLRQEREKRGITIEQVASATKIGIRLLHLLESDQYTELPAKPFIRGFVSSYARFIGIDSKEILTQFGDFLESHSQERPTRDAGHSGYAFEKRDGEQSRTVLWIVMGVFIVFGGIGFLVLKPSLKHHRSSHLEKLRDANPEPSGSPSPTLSPVAPGVEVSPSTSPSSEGSTPSPKPSSTPSLLATGTAPSRSEIVVAPTPLVLAPPAEEPGPSAKPSLKSVKPSPSPVSSPSVSPSSSPSSSGTEAKEEKPDPLNSGINLKGSEIKYKILIKATADVWVRFQVDGRPKMKFILREGRTLVLRAVESVKFQTSSPENVIIRANGSAPQSFAGNPNVAQSAPDPTLFFPAQLAKSITDPFPGEKPITGVNVPGSRGHSPVSTPAE